MKIITGATGFIGSYVLKAMPECIPCSLKSGDLNYYKCNLENLKNVDELIRRYNPNNIIHCAGNYSPKHPNNHQLMLNSHILSTTNLLEKCKEGCNFIYISSILVHGDSYPLLKPTNLYGACKLSCEKICESYAKMKDLNLTIIRPCGVVGENTTHGLIHDIIKKLQSSNEYLELFGNSPGSYRPYCHVDDLVELIKVYSNDIGPQVKIVECFPNDSLYVKDVAEIIMEKTGIQKPLKWLEEESSLGQNNYIDTSSQEFNKLLYNQSRKVIESIF